MPLTEPGYALAYRSGRFEPVADAGDRVLMLDPTGVYSGESPTSWYEVTWCEPLYGLGAKGTTMLWTYDPNNPPPGLGSLPPGAASGVFPAGSPIVSTPDVVQMGRRQLLQLRWQPRLLLPLGSGAAPPDFDFQIAVPGATPRNVVLNQQGRWNNRFQSPVPGDSLPIPSQGFGQPVSTQSLSPFDWQSQTEVFLYEQSFTASWTITNNSAVDLGASLSGTAAVCVDLMGYRLDLAPIGQADPDWVVRQLQGRPGLQPADNCVIVPISGRGQSSA